MQFPTFKFSDVKFNPTALQQGTSFSVQPLPYTPGAAAAPKTEMGELLDFVREQSGPEATKQKLEAQLAFQKEQMKQAYPYLLSRQIPETISQAFGAANALRLLGAERGTEAALRGVDAVARGQFTPYAGIQPFNYFS